MELHRPLGERNTALSKPGVRVLLVGTGKHVGGSALPDVPAVADTVRDLGHALIQQCGLDPANLRILLDPADPIALGDAITEGASHAEDVLLFYYIGHGIVSASKQLHLATHTTDDFHHGLAFKALPYSAVLDALAHCRARIVIVLDCCFAGRAHGSLGGATDDALAAAQLGGSYLLAAAASDVLALAPPGESYTAFSGELLRLLRHGDPMGPPSLTLDDVYRYLDRALRRRGAPQPQRQAAGRADDLVLAPNFAYRPPAFRAMPVPTPTDRESTALDTSPYRGLIAFGLGDVGYFFGRERLTGELVRRLAERLPDAGPLMVIGASGSGKSSLLFAGLLPALKEGRLPIPASHGWPIMVFTPGADPLLNLANRAARVSTATRTRSRSQLIDDPSWLADAAHELLQAEAADRDISGGRLILIVDQFEQLFTACTDPIEQQAFIQALCRASEAGVNGPEPHALVVIGVRADFYGHCAAFPELVAALEAGQVLVGPMSSDELVQAIEKPAAVAGLALEQGLVDLLLRDLQASRTSGSELGKLPLLSHALLATWQHRDGRHLTIAGYQATGGIAGAVARTAEETYASLDKVEQRAAQRMLLGLVRVGDGTEDTHRRAARIDLVTADPDVDQATISRVLDAFARARLLTLDEDTVQIAHEAVLHAWPRLRGWIDTDRTGLLVKQTLTDAAEAWNRERRDPAALYRGTRLSAAREWVEARHHHQLTTLTGEFLQASIRRERRRTRRLYQTISALAALFVLAALAGAGALQQRSVAVAQSAAATRERNLAISRLVASRADHIRDKDVSLAMQLSLVAYQIAATPEARASLLDSSATMPAIRMLGATGVMQSVAFSPDKRTLAAGSADKTIRLWDVTNTRRPIKLGPPLIGPGNVVYSVAFSPDGRTLAAGSGDNTVRLWDTTNLKQPVPRGQPLTGPTALVYSVAFSPDGRTLAAGSGDNTIHLWDITDPDKPAPLGRPLTGFNRSVHSVAFSPDRRTLAAGGDDNTVRLWDIRNPHRPIPLGAPLTGPTRPVFSVAFSPDGHTLAAGSGDKTVYLWSVTDTNRPHPLGPPLSGPTSFVNSVVFSPSGKTLAIASADRTVRLWNLSTRRVTAMLPHPGPATTVAFGRDDHTLVTSAADGVARLWSLPGPVLPGATDVVSSVVFSPAGDVLAVGSGDTQLWSVASREPLGPSLTNPAHFSGTIGFTPDGHTLAVSSRDGVLQMWDVTDQDEPTPLGPPLNAHSHTIESLAFSPDGHTLATGSDDNSVRLWDITNPRRPHILNTLTGFAAYVYSVAFSPDGHTLAAGSVDTTVRLWNVTDPREPVLLGPPLTGLDNHYVLSVAFSPDGRTLAVGSADATLRLWNVTNLTKPEPLGPSLTGPTGYVYSLAFNPDGRTLAAANTDGTVWLWDVAEPRSPSALATLTAATSSVYSVAFNRDGRTLAAGGTDKTVWLWNTDPEQVAAQICATTGDPITTAEWRQYVPSPLPYRSPCRRGS